MSSARSGHETRNGFALDAYGVGVEVVSDDAKIVSYEVGVKGVDRRGVWLEVRSTS